MIAWNLRDGGGVDEQSNGSRGNIADIDRKRAKGVDVKIPRKVNLEKHARSDYNDKNTDSDRKVL